MKKSIVVICLILSGCATGNGILNNGPDQDLVHAVKLSDQGKDKEAAASLKDIVARKKVMGVTDEALFRLSMTHLKAGTDREDLEQALKRLETLQREYPSSPWTHLAAPVMGVIREALRQNREIRSMAKESKEAQSLKSQNVSLSKENKELRQTIEKLKHLDLELESKPRRH